TITSNCAWTDASRERTTPSIVPDSLRAGMMTETGVSASGTWSATSGLRRASGAMATKGRAQGRAARSDTAGTSAAGGDGGELRLEGGEPILHRLGVGAGERVLATVVREQRRDQRIGVADHGLG